MRPSLVGSWTRSWLARRRGAGWCAAVVRAVPVAVADAAVLGVRTKTGEEVPHALVQLAPGAEASGSELRQFVAGTVARYKQLGGVTFVEKVPRSAAGKILRRELPALVGSGR